LPINGVQQWGLNLIGAFVRGKKTYKKRGRVELRVASRKSNVEKGARGERGSGREEKRDRSLGVRAKKKTPCQRVCRLKKCSHFYAQKYRKKKKKKNKQRGGRKSKDALGPKTQNTNQCPGPTK